jgi:hypothetical protein
MIVPDAPSWTLTIRCPGQRPTTLTYQDPETIRQAAWRFRRTAKDCQIEARSPTGLLLRGRQRWRKALRGRLGGRKGACLKYIGRRCVKWGMPENHSFGRAQKAVCIKRKGRECVKWKIDGHTVHVR